MANYHIGLDFGTSQTKVCLLNKDTEVREFVKFDNNNYFLPSLIVKKTDSTFSYGNEDVYGNKYRYFKMAAAEDDDLIQVTNEDLEGNLQNGTVDDFRKYSTNYELKPEILVILYLTYVYLFVKEKKNSPVLNEEYDFFDDDDESEAIVNTFSINLGIPTEWNNPNHIKRKIKFQSMLIAAVELANQFDSLDSYLKANYTNLLTRISEINKKHLVDLEGKNEGQKADKVKDWLKEYKLSVFAESAAGVNYLLQTRRLADGSYATLDVGAGTSDIAIFQVQDNVLRRYFCSESVEIASNDFYREYAKQFYKKKFVTFEEIVEIENIIRNNINMNNRFYDKARIIARGFRNNMGIEFAIRKTFYRKYYNPLLQQNLIEAYRVKNEVLNEKPIILFGGGANLDAFSNGDYCFYQGSNPFGVHDRHFETKPITDYVNQVDIDDKEQVKPFINLLILALGLTYTSINIDNDNHDGNDSIPFFIPANDVPPRCPQIHDRYSYYDLQDAVYK